MIKLLVSILALAVAFMPFEPHARDAKAVWDSRCEECHGDPEPFAAKYLWNIEGQLQGQHHIDNLDLFMRNHYTPSHEIEILNDMLLEQANSPVRFETECGECHGQVDEFVEKSLWVRGDTITGLDSGQDVSDFLPGHQDLQPEDVAFFTKLFFRVEQTTAP